MTTHPSLLRFFLDSGSKGRDGGARGAKAPSPPPPMFPKKYFKNTSLQPHPPPPPSPPKRLGSSRGMVCYWARHFFVTARGVNNTRILFILHVHGLYTVYFKTLSTPAANGRIKYLTRNHNTMSPSATKAAIRTTIDSKQPQFKYIIITLNHRSRDIRYNFKKCSHYNYKF